ncbi:MAG TPA: asparagine--tRNA ligase [Acidobacteriaceae bacterium]|nr:asparagine--tRNA ligase [Acidobacteriaceae bacterium]
MKTFYISNALNAIPGTGVNISCWVKGKRKTSHTLFLDIVDSTGTMQAVVHRGTLGAVPFAAATAIRIESAVSIAGTIAIGTQGALEINTASVEVIGGVVGHLSPSPRSDIDIFDPDLADHLLANRHLYLRNPKLMAVLKFRSILTSSVRQWFENHSFMEFDAPILTSLPLYDDGTAMGIDVRGRHAFLTQCVGYYLEAAVHAFERVYNMGPSFRGEESRSKRHLMEYHHIKAEIAFADFEDIISIVESLISYITTACALKTEPLLTTLGTSLCLDGLKIPFERITYQDALVHLENAGFAVRDGKGLGSLEEAELSTLFSGPFWVTGIPRAIEPFPYRIDPEQPTTCRVADLIASNGYGELLGVAEKIYTIDELDLRLAEKDKAGDHRYQWIREIHMNGCVPHVAFGMGVERLIRWLLNIPHVRDAIPFPRIFRRNIYP